MSINQLAGCLKVCNNCVHRNECMQVKECVAIAQRDDGKIICYSQRQRIVSNNNRVKQ